MNAIIYYIVYPLLFTLSYLPFFIIYRISDLVFVILYYVVGYRKKVVTENLTNSFPKKSMEEIKKIRKTFYRSFTDILLETIKSFTISNKTLLQKCTPQNMEVIQKYIDEKRNVLFVLGHYGNWEWGAGAFGISTTLQLKSAYKPLSNKYFDRLMFRSRGRFNINLLPKQALIDDLQKAGTKQTLLALIADQSPNPKNHYWVRFLNQDTAVVKGMEKIARDYDYVTMYASIRPVKRGNYAITFSLLHEHPAKLPEGKLTELFMQSLEKDIEEYPPAYLWSHKRWKLKKTAADSPNLPIN